MMLFIPESTVFDHQIHCGAMLIYLLSMILVYSRHTSGPVSDEKMSFYVFLQPMRVLSGWLGS